MIVKLRPELTNPSGLSLCLRQDLCLSYFPCPTLLSTVSRGPDILLWSTYHSRTDKKNIQQTLIITTKISGHLFVLYSGFEYFFCLFLLYAFQVDSVVITFLHTGMATLVIMANQISRPTKSIVL